jgi:hypothetical protein
MAGAPNLVLGKVLFDQELAILELSDKIDACSNLCEEYCECFQMIFLLPLISS